MANNNEYINITIGALWKKTSAKGTEYLSGKFGDKYINVFANHNKKSDNEPDFNIQMSVKRD